MIKNFLQNQRSKKNDFIIQSMIFFSFIRSNDRFNFIPQARRGLNRGYGAIRRHAPPPEQAQRNSPYAPAPPRGPGRSHPHRFQDQDEEDESTTSTDDAEMQSEESDGGDPGLAVEPVTGPSSSSTSQVCSNKKTFEKGRMI